VARAIPHALEMSHFFTTQGHTTMTFSFFTLRHHAAICGAALTLAPTASIPATANEPASTQAQLDTRSDS
jgi:hypothetical protein